MDNWTILAGALALSSVALSLYEIARHLSNFTKPYLQRYIIRIMLMVPIYSLNAWFAMLVPETALYLDAIREAYESFVIYSFMKYLLNFLNYDTNLQQYIDHKPGPRHIVPLCCLPRCSGGRAFLGRCKHGILQYVVIRPITALLAFTSQQLGIYGEGNYNPVSGTTYPILLLINNASQVLAMYCLVIFYTGYAQELRPMRPLAKFFSIKLVVFFSFFQSVLIAGLLEIGVVEQTLKPFFPNEQDKLALGRKLQELLICVDMLIAAIGHLYAFTHKPYTDFDYSRSARLITSDGELTYDPEHAAALAGAGTSDGTGIGLDKTCCGALCSILDFSEEKSDISEHFGQIWWRLKQVFSFQAALPTIVSDVNVREGAQAEEGRASARTTTTASQRTRREKRRSRRALSEQEDSGGGGGGSGSRSSKGAKKVLSSSASTSLPTPTPPQPLGASIEAEEEEEGEEGRALGEDRAMSSSGGSRKNYQSID